VDRNPLELGKLLFAAIIQRFRESWNGSGSRFMDKLETAKQFALKYYPRDHVYLAGALLLLFLISLLLPGSENPEQSPAVSSDSSRISVPVGPQSGQDADPGSAGEVSAPQLASAESMPTSEPAAINMSDYVVSDEPQLADITVWKNFEVQQGDTLSTIFSKVGLTDQDMFQVLNSSEEAKVLNRLYPGYQLDFMVPDQGELEQLRVMSSPLEGFLFTRADNGYRAERILKEAQLQQAFKVGTIADSLFMAGQQQNIPAIHIMEMANIFGGVIDFILDPRAGDEFSILYEEKYLDGDFIGPGDIIATQYINQGKVYTAVRYENLDGEVGFYSPEGESMRKAFLRSPLDVFRISSNFNPNRRHPILNTIRAHKGTDYAAPTGTPIRATGDGRVTHAGRYGSFGNLVVLNHAGGFETKYAHLSRYANGISKGDRVRQGDIIGYVGATGGATGPHLHYEFLVNGVHQNPRTIVDRLPKAESIDTAEMDRFKAQTAELLERFQELNSTLVLTLNQPGAD
jgi:murein DD-endopeptidase MepM/ murein hydrolase activator NlpD